MFAIIAFIPIIVTIIVMAGFNWPAKIALPLAWLITAVVCFFGWQMDFITIAAHTVSGFLTSIDTIVIIFRCNFNHEHVETFWGYGCYQPYVHQYQR